MIEKRSKCFLGLVLIFVSFTSYGKGKGGGMTINGQPTYQLASPYPDGRDQVQPNCSSVQAKGQGHHNKAPIIIEAPHSTQSAGVTVTQQDKVNGRALMPTVCNGIAPFTYILSGVSGGSISGTWEGGASNALSYKTSLRNPVFRLNVATPGIFYAQIEVVDSKGDSVKAPMGIQVYDAVVASAQPTQPTQPAFNTGSELPSLCENVRSSGCAVVNSSYACFKNPKTGRFELHPVSHSNFGGAGSGSSSLAAEDGTPVHVGFSTPVTYQQAGANATAYRDSDNQPFTGTVYDSKSGNYAQFVNGQMTGSYTRTDMCASY